MPTEREAALRGRGGWSRTPPEADRYSSCLTIGRPAKRRGIHRSPGAAQDNISPAGRREKPEYGERRA
nr:MAG TPA: hypothetical protein [Caudoviricetes sp.]